METQTLYDITCIRNLKNTANLVKITEEESRLKENKPVITSEEREGSSIGAED